MVKPGNFVLELPMNTVVFCPVEKFCKNVGILMVAGQEGISAVNLKYVTRVNYNR
jgi:hypothetical protein